MGPWVPLPIQTRLQAAREVSTKGQEVPGASGHPSWARLHQPGPEQGGPLPCDCDVKDRMPTKPRPGLLQQGDGQPPATPTRVPLPLGPAGSQPLGAGPLGLWLAPCSFSFTLPLLPGLRGAVSPWR